VSGWDDPVSLGEVWSRAVADGPDRTFLVFERADGATHEWTYAEFDLLAARAAGHLRERGVGHGDAVHLALTNSPAFVAIWLACMRLGAWIVPSDPLGQVPELAEHIDRTRPRAGVSSTARADTYAKAVSEAGVAINVVEVDESDGELAALGDIEVCGWPQLDPLDRAAVMFTSGTTGRPKGVEITQANYAFAGKVMAEAANLTAEHRQLVVLPLFHANAQYYSFASAIWAGASVALMSTFSARGFLAQAARHRATHASLFAAPIRMILARGGTAVDGVALAHCWFAQNIADAQYDTLAGLLGCGPRQLYGMTETIPAVLTDRAEATVPSSIGFVTPGCTVEVQRPDGSPVEPGEEGEIVVGGEPGITLFAGYLDDPATTEASFRHGWFLTGDRATSDDDGRHRFVGRRSDVLKVAGENVSTVEVEQVLAAHPGVLEAAVVGMPDPVRDEVPVAFVVAADPAAPPSPDELLGWCEERLGKAKRPREITFLAELPRTSVGKIRKFVLKEGA
jgi:carnitine-CoA ligase